ncbi:hypothetical protein [Halobacteriovorax sp. HLS]|uniref:hypothetical protein n=1 Tax=Halobacteriovorax sp. HLS TaxID=2234000 RepID=UPI000FDB8CC3|nr:hypothetical protein [Halobacteriovorax sp. HLS]
MKIIKRITIAFVLLSSVVIADDLVEIESRGLSIKNFPCMKCHGDFTHDKINELPLATPHERLEFKHHDNIKNCYSCHDKGDRNQLVLHTGEKIGFDQSYRQCFQCHGEKKRDWELGIHGKMVGSWSGKKYKSTCTSCHNPHKPKFRLMKADPGPVHPQGKKHNGGGH